MATELFSNNARGVIAGDVSMDDRYIVLEDDGGVQTFATPPRNATGEFFQRATIYHPDDPDHNEIVSITDVDRFQNKLTVVRAWETYNRQSSEWPAGSIIEARVTAGMLGSLSKKTTVIDEETGSRYLTDIIKVPGDSYPSSETPMFGAMMTGHSVNVSLGTPEVWGPSAINEGEIVTHPGAPNAYFVALDWWGYEQQLPALPDPQEGVTESGVVVLESDAEKTCRFYAQRTDEPITIQLNGDGIGMVVTEVGFVSIQNGGGGPAQISVSVGGVQLVQNTSIDEPDGSVVRFFNQSQRLAPTDLIQVDVLTRSTSEMKGYFYWVGFAAGPVLP